jgi:hypothetical protein
MLVASAALGQGYYNYPYYGGGIGSTPFGSYLGGMAQTIRAQGEYNVMSSQAEINLEEAQKKDIENQVQWTGAYIEMRRMRDAYVESKKLPPTPPETWTRIAHESAPKRLTASLLDPVTGAIGWPALLRTDEFAGERESLDQLFAQRASTHGAIGKNGYAKIRAITDKALEKLKVHIRDVSLNEYHAARNFLTSLRYEADFPAG